MPSWTTFDEPPEFDVGDRVVTRVAVGPAWKRTLPRGSRGIVIARTVDRLVAVRFATGQVEHLHPSDLRIDETAT